VANFFLLGSRPSQKTSGGAMSKAIQEQNTEFQIWKGLESDVAYLMERVRSLEAARPPPPDRLLNQEAAAAMIGVKPPTLASWRHYDKGPRYLKVGRSCFYRMSDIEKWLNTQAVIPLRRNDAGAVA
jgi:predicted DNA-binding transcriptional regulator AlpA